jgi:hypothetical protein
MKAISKCLKGRENVTYIIVLIIFVHPSITLVFGDNFSSVFHNDLVGLKTAIASDTIATILSFDDLNANSVLSTTLAALL